MNRTLQLRCLLCILTAILIVLLTIPALLYREDAASRSRQGVFISMDTEETCLRTELPTQIAEPLPPDFPPTAAAAGAFRFF